MINLTVVIDNDEAVKKLRELQNVAKTTTSSVVKDSERIDYVFSKIDDTLKRLVAGISIETLVRQLVQVRGEVQQLEVAFETMLGSKEKADKLVNEAVQLAAKTPFGLQDVSNGAKMLLAYGSAAEEVTEEIKMLGNIASGLSIPLNDMIYLYGTTRTQGRMFTQDLRQFMGRGIPLAEELAKQFGVTKDEVGELVTAGKVGFDEMAKALQAMTSEGGQFNNLMDKQSQTITGQISNLEDSIYQMFNAIGEKSEGIISGTIDVVASLVENYERVGRVLMGLVATYGTYKVAIVAYNVATAIAANAAKGMALAEQIRMSATIAAEKAQKMLNKTMLLNPWVLAATAVAGLVTLLISQKNETERLREAEEEYNNAKQETINKEEEHKRAIESLLNVAEDEAASSDTRRAALNNLIMRYPEVFSKYGTEIEMLKDIKRIKLEIAQIEAGKSITNPKNELEGVDARIAELEAKRDKVIYTYDRRGIGKPSKQGLSKKEEAEYKNLLAQRDKLQKEIRENNRKTYLDNVGQLSAPQLTAEIERLKEAQQILTLYNATKGQVGKTGEAIVYAGQLAKLGYSVNDAQKISGELTILNAEQNRRKAKKVTAGDWLKAKKDEWEKAEKAYNDFLKKKGKMSEEDFEKQSQELKEAAETAKKEYQKYAPTAGKKTSASDNQKNDAENDAEKAFELSQKIQQEALQSEIDLMAEGTAKKIAQIDADYEQQRAEIVKKENELRDLQGELTQEQIDNFSMLYDNLAEKRSRDILDAANQSGEDYLIQYGNEEERRTAINNKYDRLVDGTDDVYAQQMYEKQREEELNADIIALENYYIQLGTLAEKIRATKAKYERQIRDAKNDGERKALEAERDALLAEYDEQASNWANSLVDMTTAQLNNMLAELQTEVEAKQEAFDALDASDSNDAQKYREEINRLNARIKILQAELGKARRSAGDKNWDKAVQTFQNIANSATEAADGIAEFDEDLGNTLRSIAQLASSGLNLVVVIKKITDASWTGVAAISALEKASLILAAISAAIQVVAVLFDLFKQNDEVENTKKAFAELNDELVRLRKLARIDNVEGTIFGSNSFGNFINNLKAAHDALKDFEASKEAIRLKDVQYMETVIGFNPDGTAVTIQTPQGRQNLNDAISGMQVMTKHKTWFTPREYEDLGDLMPELFDEFGNVTLEGLQNLQNSDVWNKLSKEDRELIEQMIADWEDYNAAVEATEKYLSDVFGNLGGDITNALLDSFKNGTDAAEAFGEATGKILERLASDIVNMALIQPIMDEAEAEVLELQEKLEAGDISYEEYLRQTQAILVKARSKAQERTDDAYDMYEAAGIEQNGSGSSSATSKGFQTMSQETGSELNGRFTDIQGQTHRIAEAVEFCKSLHIENLTQVQSINATVAMIHNDTSLIAQHTRALAQMQDDLASIRRSMDNGAI
ncbi:MAG: tape measure protein [Alistipes sp.]|nr:tape measure protein [Alistipes sp.]